MTLAANDPRPASVQAADVLRREIAEGKYPDGKLPTTRALAQRFGIAGQTLSNGLRILAAEGLIFSAGNRGYFIAKGEDDDGSGVRSNQDVREEIKGIHSEIQALAARVAALEELSRSSRD